MVRLSWRQHLALTLPILTFAACGSAIRGQADKLASATTTSAAPAAPIADLRPPVSVTIDPVLTLIDESERHFDAGRRELALGHMAGARREFNQSLEVLLESPYGGRTEPRIREQFDRLVDRISATEVKALTEGDGFTEQTYEPASIDELLSISATLTPAPSPDLEHTVRSDLASNDHDISIPLNQRVLSYIELFKGRLHDFIEDGLTRGGQYLPMIQNVFRAEGLPLDLAYVPLIESAFKPNALSRTKAKGVWQFMASTAAENGLRHDWYIDERSDPEKATEAAAKYLHSLHELFDGDWQLALASYNGGPTRLQRAIRRLGVDDFWKLAARPHVLPRETREYVPMILAAIVIARNPAQYGFDVASEPAPAYERVRLPFPVDLRRIAEWTDSTIDQIQTLNPELRRWTTPIRDDDYEVKVPAGTGARVRQQLQDVSPQEAASLNWYAVRPGDTLLRVAHRLHVRRSDLAEANYLSVRSRLTPGQKLVVPQEATALMAAQADRPAPVTEARPTVATTGHTESGVPAGRVKVVYQVRRGDTLSSIARVFRTTVAALKSWNRLPNSRISVGDRLTIFKRAD
jgi:membrane-bound lytic murein transglycosylase D